jgi:hypothetical protein
MTLADALKLATSLAAAIENVDDQGKVIVSLNDNVRQLMMRASFSDLDGYSISLDANE